MSTQLELLGDRRVIDNLVVNHTCDMRKTQLLGCSIVLFTALVNLIAPSAQAQSLTLSPNFSPNPRSIAGAGGGSTAITDVLAPGSSPDGQCVGYANAQPSFTVVLTEFFGSLSLAVESPEDTALAIEGPGGIWCNDDFDGKNPGISGEWLPGTYKIWVTSYAKGRSPAYTLRITEGR